MLSLKKHTNFDSFNFMLPESRLYSFIDQKEGFTLHFLEGQKLIHDVAIVHGIHGEGFHFFRDIMLSTQMLMAYLKPGEGLGIYLDSEVPYFRFKIEMSDSGQMRTLLLPEDMNLFPKKITGRCRLAKTAPDEKQPYTSIIDLVETNLSDVINKILKDSYQLNSKIYLSTESDQAVMITKLPSIDINRVQTNYTLTTDEYWLKNKIKINELFSKFTTEYSEIQSFFENLDLLMIASRELKFKCTCSRDRMIQGIWLLIKNAGIESVFYENETEIETKCDYCKTKYTISRNEFLN